MKLIIGTSMALMTMMACTHVDNVSDDDDDNDVDDISWDVDSLKGVHHAAPVQESIAIDLSDDDETAFISA